MRQYIFMILMGTSLTYGQAADPFAPIKPELAQIIYQTLQDIHDFCTLYDIPYWIDSGTLLGAVRHYGLIPWDDDLDLCIFEKDEAKFVMLFPILQQYGYEIIRVQPFGYKIFSIHAADTPGAPWKYPGCDIFIVKTDDQKAFYKYHWAKESAGNLELDLTDILPLRTYRFGPLYVNGPRNPLAYFEKWYGSDCLTVAYRDYDHGSEKFFEPVKKLLSKKDCKPLFPEQPLKHRVIAPHIPAWPQDFPEALAMFR